MFLVVPYVTDGCSTRVFDFKPVSRISDTCTLLGLLQSEEL